MSEVVRISHLIKYVWVGLEIALVGQFFLQPICTSPFWCTFHDPNYSRWRNQSFIVEYLISLFAYIWVDVTFVYYCRLLLLWPQSISTFKIENYSSQSCRKFKTVHAFRWSHIIRQCSDSIQHCASRWFYCQWSGPMRAGLRSKLLCQINQYAKR